METLHFFGTFDVENYGDLLFPRVVMSRLPGFDISPVSPLKRPAVWEDCVSPSNLDNLIGQKTNGVIIGGGNIVHPNKSPLVAYKAAGVDIHAYADLWIGASLAAPQGIPVVWNAPGIPKPIPTAFIDIARRALERADYLSVRDHISRRFLLDIHPEVNIDIVPDSAWDLPLLWPSDVLDEEFETLVKDEEGPFFAVHLNDRYVKDITPEELAAELDGVAKVLDARPILIAIGPCHNDGEFARHMGVLLESSSLVLDQPTSTRQVCAAISRSKFYVGSSMHGYITAAAFGVPAVVVAKNVVKFEGATLLAGAPETLITSWKEMVRTVDDLDLDALSRRFLRGQVQASERLTVHWDKLAALLDSAEQASCWAKDDIYFYRADFLGAACRAEAQTVRELKEIVNRRSKASLQKKKSNRQTATSVTTNRIRKDRSLLSNAFRNLYKRGS